MDFMNLKLYHSRKYMKYFAIFAIFAGLSLHTNFNLSEVFTKEEAKEIRVKFWEGQALLQAETYLPEMGTHGGEDTIHAVKILRGPGEGSRVIPNRP